MNPDRWLDSRRFPGRRWLPGLVRAEGPLTPAPSAWSRREQRCREAVAAALGVDVDRVLLLPRRADACALLTRALLDPTGCALVARPCAPAWLAATLATGARYVDVGRLERGAWDPAVVPAAVHAWPDAVALLEAPNLWGAADEPALPAAMPRLVDADRAAALVAAPAPGADATVVAIRDPAPPHDTVLHVVVASAEAIAALTALAGPDLLPDLLLRRALAALATRERDADAAEAAYASHLRQRYDALAAALPAGPGRRLLPRAGTVAAIACRAGDSAEVAAALVGQGWSAAAWSAFPGRGLVQIRL